MMADQHHGSADNRNQPSGRSRKHKKSHHHKHENLPPKNAYQTARPDLSRQPELESSPGNGFDAHESLSKLLKLKDITSTDIGYVRDQKSHIPLDEIQRSEGLVESPQFQEWIVDPKSKKLLIHGNLHVPNFTSGLAMLCVKLAQPAIQTIAGVKRFMSVVFFCGCHIDMGNKHLGHYGVKGMLKSFIEQMLSQQKSFPWLLDENIVLPASGGDIHALFEVFRLLACQIPEEVTLICIIDGINFFEIDYCAIDMQTVLTMLLTLLEDPGMKIRVKLVVTSPLETRFVQQFDGCVLPIYFPIKQLEYPEPLI